MRLDELDGFVRRGCCFWFWCLRYILGICGGFGLVLGLDCVVKVVGGLLWGLPCCLFCLVLLICWWLFLF